VSQINNSKDFKYFNAIAITFVICLITSNLAATKLWQIYSFTLPGGMIIFPLLYVLNDILTEVYGFTASRRVILTALFCSMFVNAILWIVVLLPPAEHWSNHESFSNIFSLTPRIFIASFSGYFVGELLNSLTISTLKILLEGRNFAIRAILSTCVGAAAESIIFANIAFIGLLPAKQILSIILTMTVIKVVYEIIVLPITVKLTAFLKTSEGIDSFETPSWRGIFNCYK
jgi:uncharacterized integral membrane protein (TIGR00697 family)